MFKTLNLNHLRLSSKYLLTNRWLSSQNIKTNEELMKIEDKKGLLFNENNENIEKIEKIDKQLNELIENAVKDSKRLDRIWETNILYDDKTEYNKDIEWYHTDRRRLNNKIQLFSFVFWDVFSLVGLKKRLKYWIRYRERNQQRYVAKRHAILGPELAVATFMVGRGGKIRFTHAPNEWSTSLRHFPDKYDNRYKVLSIDASALKLRYEGIDNLQELDSLRELNLSNNLMDDWSCDKLGRIFRDSNLSVLDLSDNPMITHRGIETLHRIRSLRELNIKGTEASKYPFLELLTLYFNDLVPKCQLIH